MKKDDFVKISLDDKELVWVKVKRVYKSFFIGILSNEPVVIKGLKYGDKILVNKSMIVKTKRVKFQSD